MLNQDFLKELYGDDAAYAAHMFSLFQESVLPDIHEIGKLIDEERWNEVRQLVHKVKPTLAMVGLREMEAQLGTFEEWCLMPEKRSVLNRAWPVFYKDLIHVLPVVEAQKQRYLANVTP